MPLFIRWIIIVSVLNLQANAFKVVFDGWVLTQTTLFEASENNVEEWTGINLNPQWAATYLWAYTVFRRGKYFYFIEASNNLMRLDTIEKKLEKIVYS